MTHLDLAPDVLHDNGWGYWAKSYGKVGNRPLLEIMPLANHRLLKDAGFRRHVDNSANRQSGYVDGDRAMALASIDAVTVSEVEFAWRMEIILANVSRKLAQVKARLCADVTPPLDP